MLRSLRSALVRFTVRRAAACRRHAPRRADWWLGLGCIITPVFAQPYPALVRLRRAIEDRWGAVAAAQDATERFPENSDAWMLLAEAYQMAFRQKEALAAYEQALGPTPRAAAPRRCGSMPRRCSRPAISRRRTRHCTSGRPKSRVGWSASRKCEPSCWRGSGTAARAMLNRSLRGRDW